MKRKILTRDLRRRISLSLKGINDGREVDRHKSRRTDNITKLTSEPSPGRNGGWANAKIRAGTLGSAFYKRAGGGHGGERATVLCLT